MYLYVFVVWVGSGPGVAGVEGKKNPPHVPRYMFPATVDVSRFSLGLRSGLGLVLGSDGITMNNIRYMLRHKNSRSCWICR